MGLVRHRHIMRCLLHMIARPETRALTKLVDRSITRTQLTATGLKKENIDRKVTVRPQATTVPARVRTHPIVGQSTKLVRIRTVPEDILPGDLSGAHAKATEMTSIQLCSHRDVPGVELVVIFGHGRRRRSRGNHHQRCVAPLIGSEDGRSAGPPALLGRRALWTDCLRCASPTSSRS